MISLCVSVMICRKRGGKVPRISIDERFEVFMAVKIEVAVYWVLVTPRSDVVGYQRFGAPCCLFDISIQPVCLAMILQACLMDSPKSNLR